MSAWCIAGASFIGGVLVGSFIMFALMVLEDDEPTPPCPLCKTYGKRADLP